MKDRGGSVRGPWRRCSACFGVCFWCDGWWLCRSCDSEWSPESDADLYADPVEA